MAFHLAIWIIGWKLLSWLECVSMQTQTVEREQFADAFSVKCASCNAFGAFCVLGTPCCQKCQCNSGRTYFRNPDRNILSQTCVDYPDREEGCRFFVFGRQYAGTPLLAANIDRVARYLVGSIVREGDFKVGMIKNCQIVREESRYWNNEKWLPLFQDGRSPSDWTLTFDEKSKNDLQWSSSNWAPYLGLIIKFAIRCSEGGSSCFMLKIVGSRTYASDVIEPVLQTSTVSPPSTVSSTSTRTAVMTTRTSRFSTRGSSLKSTMSGNSTVVLPKHARSRGSFPVLILVGVLLTVLVLVAIVLAVIFVRRRRRKGEGRHKYFFPRNPKQQSRLKLLQKSKSKEEVPIYQSPDASYDCDKPSSVDDGYLEMFPPLKKKSVVEIGNPVYLQPTEMQSHTDKSTKKEPKYDELKLEGLQQNEMPFGSTDGGTTPSRHVYASLKEHDPEPVKPHEYVDLDNIVVPPQKRQSAGYMGLEESVSLELQRSSNYEALDKSTLPCLSKTNIYTEPMDKGLKNGDLPSPKYFQLESDEKNRLTCHVYDGEVAI